MPPAPGVGAPRPAQHVPAYLPATGMRSCSVRAPMWPRLPIRADSLPIRHMPPPPGPASGTGGQLGATGGKRTALRLRVKVVRIEPAVRRSAAGLLPLVWPALAGVTTSRAGPVPQHPVPVRHPAQSSTLVPGCSRTYSAPDGAAAAFIRLIRSRGES